MGNCEEFPSLCHFLYRMEVRNLSDNYILWEDVAQYPGHGVEKDSRWQKISKRKVKYMVTQDLEWPSGSLTVVGKSHWELHCVIPILTGSHSILKCRRMLLLETKDVPETPYSCSQKSTTYSVWSYSQVAVCSYRSSLFVYSSLLRNISPKIVIWKNPTVACFITASFILCYFVFIFTCSVFFTFKSGFSGGVFLHAADV